MPSYDAGQASIKVVPNADSFRRDLEADLKKVRAEFSIDVKANTAQAKADIDRLRDDQRDRHLHLGVDVALAQAKADMDKFREQQRRDGLTIKADLDTDTARRKARQLGNDVKSDLKAALSDIGDGLSGVFDALKTPTLFAGLGELPAAATAIATLSGSLEQLAGAGAVIPGIFAGIGSEVGVVKLATEGVGDAFKALDKAQQDSGASAKAQAKDLQATKDALAKLAPQTADFVQQVYSLKPAFEDLQKGVSGRFFDGLGDSVKNLASADLPLLNKGLGGIADALNGSLKQIGISLSSGSSQGLLDRIFGNTAEAQNRLTKAIDPLIKGVGTLAAAGTDALPRLADDVGKVAERFSSFITGADKDGSLSKFINDGITGVEHLGDAAINIGKIFNDITQSAGGGGGFLQFLDDSTKKLDDFLKTPKGQQDLKNFFAEGKKDIGELVEVAKKLPDVLSGAFKAGQDAANVLLPAFDDLLSIIHAIPGGAHTVIDAFLLWKGITAASDLVSSFDKLRALLNTDIPADAKKAEDAIKGVKDAQAGKDAADALDPATGLPIPGGPAAKAAEKEAAEKAAKEAKAARDAALKERGPLGRLAAGALNVGGKVAGAAGAVGGATVLGLPALIAAPLAIGAGTGAYLASEAPDNPGRPGAGRPGTGAPGRFQAPHPESIDDRLAKLHEAQAAADRLAQTIASFPPGNIDIKNNAPDVQKNIEALRDAIRNIPPGKADILVTYMVDGHPISLDQLRTPIRVAATPGGSAPTTGGGRAAGGSIDGPGRKGVDSIPTMLAPGEHVFTASDVDKMGGQSGAYRFRAALQAGRVPHMAGGGNPLDFLSIATGAVAGGTPPGPGATTDSGGGGIGGGLFGGLLGKFLPGLGGGSSSDGSGDGKKDAGAFLGDTLGKAALSFGTTLYQGVLGFFGLQDSILSPSNPYFQDATKGLGFFLGSDGPLGGTTDSSGKKTKAPTEKQLREGGQKVTRADQRVAEIQQRISELKPDAKDSQKLTLQNDLANAQQDAADARTDLGSLGNGNSGTSSSAGLGSVPSSITGNQAAVYQAMLNAGFGPEQWPPLKNLIDHESGFNPAAKNPSSGAFGIFQFLGHQGDKYGQLGGYSSDPAQQSVAGLQYIKDRYGTPSAAWAQYFAHPGGVGYYNAGGGVDTVPAMLTPGEHVLTTSDVKALGGQSGVYALREAIHMADGGTVPLSLPVKPNFNTPDIKQLIPRPAAPRPQAPVYKPVQLPAATVPPPTAPATPPADQPAAAPQFGGPAPIGGGGDTGSHTLPAISKGVTAGASAIGNIAAAAAGAAGFGGGAAGPLIQGLTQIGGKAVNDLIDVGSAFLVGNITGGTQANQYGETLRPAQNAPVTAPLNQSRQYVFNGIDGRNVADSLRLQDQQDAQATLASQRG